MSNIPISKFIQDLEKENVKVQNQIYNLKTLERLKEIALRYEGEDKIVSSYDIEKKIKNEPEEEKIMSGFHGLDEILHGFRKEQLVVISAITKSGKTQFCIDLTSRWKKYNPLWFPFEESARELIGKFIEAGERPPLFYTPEIIKDNKIEWIEKRIIESIAKFDSQIVFIDQLDFIVPFGGDNHSLRIGQAMRDVKGLAKKWNVLIFLICHLTKTEMDKQPTLEDLRGSSSIAQEADTVILLWREMKKIKNQVVISNRTNVSVQANRKTGRTGNVKMVFNNGKFVEDDWKDEDTTDWGIFGDKK